MAGDRWLVPKWQDSTEAKDYLNLLLRRNKRRQFGLLEEPAQGQSGASVIRYKVLLWGKAGVGKTSTIAKLCGLKVPPLHYETPGIRVTSTFWPAKLERQGKVVFFRLDFWDVGDKACAKFDHILPACKEKLDAVMFLFSFTDRASFEDLPNQMSQLLPKESNVLKLIVGTRFDQFSRSDVSEVELRTFAQHFEIPVLRIRNVDNVRPSATGAATIDGKASLLEIAPLMNTVGDFLLQRDQQMANPRSAASTSSVSLPLANMATALPRAPHQQAPHMEKSAHSAISRTSGESGQSDRWQQGSNLQSPPSPNAASSVGDIPIGPNRKSSSTSAMNRQSHSYLHQDDFHHHHSASGHGHHQPSEQGSLQSVPEAGGHASSARSRSSNAGHSDSRSQTPYLMHMQRLPPSHVRHHGDPNIVQAKQKSLSLPNHAKRKSGLSPTEFSPVGSAATTPGSTGESGSSKRLTTDV